MHELLLKLGERQRRGSRPRCLMLMEGKKEKVAKCLTELVALSDVVVPHDAFYMPTGLPFRLASGKWDMAPIKEAKLGAVDGFLTSEKRTGVSNWWLKVKQGANTPNWDIASFCLIKGKPGILLVEAKAHHKEMLQGKYGKKLEKDASEKSRSNHDQIYGAIQIANRGLEKATKLKWNLSSDRHYQLSNRFAWAWMLTSMGVPVVLMYLGFLCASEMPNPFNNPEEWEEIVRKHSTDVVPDCTWDKPAKIGSVPLIACIRSKRLNLP